MAQTSSPAPAAALRRSAIAASRGSVLAIHAAAGMAVSVDREAARLLRASEGLARAAVACLELAGRRPVSSPAAPVGGDATGSAKKEKTNKKKALSGKGKGKGKAKGVKSTLMEVEPAVVPGVPVALLRSEAAAFVPAAECSVLSDEWADGVVVFGPAAPPPADRVPGRDGFPDRPRRSLVARRSGSRSPHLDDGQLADPSAPPLVAGHFAAIKALVKRPDLDGKLVRLVEFDGAAGRWACALRCGERLRVIPGKLQGFTTEFQAQAKLRFEEAVL